MLVYPLDGIFSLCTKFEVLSFTQMKFRDTEPALGEGEQGPRPGPRTCRGPAEHQRGAAAPHHVKTPRGGASARGTWHATRVFWFWGPRNVPAEANRNL